MDLKGTVAVVTGGNGGLGQRICHALAAQGCHIAVVYAQSKDQADGVARDLEKHQVGAAAFACDVTKRDQVQRMVGTLLSLEEPPEPDHAADALAVAICHANGAPLKEALG